MKTRLLAALLILLAMYFLRPQPKTNVAPEPLPSTQETTPVAPESTPPAPVVSAPSASVEPPPPIVNENPPPPARPTRFNPKSERRLDLARPRSVKELLDNRSPFRQPQLPTKAGGRPVRPDSDVLGYFAGYAYYADKSAHRLRLMRAWGELKMCMSTIWSTRPALPRRRSGLPHPGWFA